jgi:hypothetical protein
VVEEEAAEEQQMKLYLRSGGVCVVCVFAGGVLDYWWFDCWRAARICALVCVVTGGVFSDWWLV